MNRIIFLGFISIIVYFSNLGGTSIYILDEAKNAGCAMEMKKNDTWLVPTFNGQLRTDKPPLHYYAMKLAYSLFGVTPFAARFFSALAGVFLILLVYWQVSVIVDQSTAFHSALVLLSSLQLTIQFHLAVPDPYLILFFTASLLFFYRGFHHDHRWLYAFYITAAFAFLTKGLIAIVLPGIIMLFYLALTKNLTWQCFKKLHFWKGALLFSVIAFPWYIAVGIATEGAWLKGFFLEHNIERYTSTMEGHRGFPLAPFVILIGALLPFSVFIISAIQFVWKERVKRDFLFYSLIVCVVFAGFFSFSKTILPTYPAPAIPFLGIILGAFLLELSRRESKSRYRWVPFALMMVITVGIGCAAYLAIQYEESLNSMKGVILYFLILPVGCLTGWYFYSIKRKALFIYMWCGSWILMGLIFFHLIYPRIDIQNPVSASLPLVETLYGNRKWIVFKQFNPAYVFSSGRQLPVVESSAEILNEVSNGEQILVITRSKYLFEIPEGFKVVYKSKDLFENNETVVLAN